MTVLKIKAAVRERDGDCCTECGMTNIESIRQYNRSLDVHRVEPGSAYSIDGCATLCNKCHRSKPQSPRPHRTRPAVPPRPVIVRLPSELAEVIDAKAKNEYSDRTKIVIAAVVDHLRRTGYLPTPKKK